MIGAKIFIRENRRNNEAAFLAAERNIHSGKKIQSAAFSAFEKIASRIKWRRKSAVPVKIYAITSSGSDPHRLQGSDNLRFDESILIDERIFRIGQCLARPN